VLGKAVAVFVLAWAVISLGLGVVRIDAENYTVRVRTPASAAQAERGDEFARRLPTIDASLPRSTSVLVVWMSSSPGYAVPIADVPEAAVWWAYSVGNYWLYPRRVLVSTDPADAASTNRDVVIVVRSPSDNEPAVASELTPASVYTSPTQVVTVYRRTGSP
jgi:hypothetical protein